MTFVPGLQTRQGTDFYHRHHRHCQHDGSQARLHREIDHSRISLDRLLPVSTWPTQFTVQLRAYVDEACTDHTHYTPIEALRCIALKVRQALLNADGKLGNRHASEPCSREAPEA